jgi:MYXO-CTERM domain-containing protein
VSVNADEKVVGWYYANKNNIWDEPGEVDDYLCYAASAANLIAWWQDNHRKVASENAPKKLEDIWQTYVRNNQIPGSGGTTCAAINWWLSGVYSPLNDDTGKWANKEDSIWERFYAEPDAMYQSVEDEILPMTLPNYKQKDAASGEYKDFGGYYYDQYGLTQQNLSDFLVTEWERDIPTESGTTHSTLTMGEVNVGEDGDTENIYDIPFVSILNESPIALTIYSVNPNPDAENPAPLAHAITLWGVEYENGELVRIWLTDSDDVDDRTDENGLFSVPVIMDRDKNMIYLDDDPGDGAIFCEEYGYDVFIAEILSIKPSEAATWSVPEPATATLSLLALAALAARRRR